ncbi:MAG TPA: Asp-tRNA(Asn)/Glu-tRNA(Gln) amidotransferase GatCAB subunit B, partial [Anaerolineae bacterium]|nr:Asp-tRNA(Asn)/Glu-tRNA(Gln) amidotransferase GatCAB subunit B [Anaerolineae bacterium]
MEYEPVIGLEVHAQIHTGSKMFCSCPVVEDTGDLPPNTYVCPVCTAMPGTLPVINRRAVEMTILTGLALHCRINPITRFSRKNYFYPDLPKGYQISQYDEP